MGFGFLLFGYLTAFLLKSSANAVGIGSLALLVGYGLMVVGIWKLRVYEQLFRFALLPLGFLLIADGYHLAPIWQDYLWTNVFLSLDNRKVNR